MAYADQRRWSSHGARRNDATWEHPLSDARYGAYVDALEAELAARVEKRRAFQRFLKETAQAREQRAALAVSKSVPQDAQSRTVIGDSASCRHTAGATEPRPETEVHPLHQGSFPQAEDRVRGRESQDQRSATQNEPPGRNNRPPAASFAPKDHECSRPAGGDCSSREQNSASASSIG